MRIAICDDLMNDAKKLREIILSHHISDGADIRIYSSPSRLLDDCRGDVLFDIVFLDISMPDTDGITLAGNINTYQKEDKPFIVFVTSYPEFAIDAFDCGAFHYILKPLDEKKILSLLDRIFTVYRDKNKYKYYLINTKKLTQRIPLSSIYYIEHYKKHIIFHLENEDIEVPGKLSEALQKLSGHGFCKVHQGYIVNMDKIKKFTEQGIILCDGRSVMMSYRRRQDVLLTYSKFVERSLV